MGSKENTRGKLGVKNGYVCLCSACIQSVGPLKALYTLPFIPVHSDTNSTSLGSILATQKLRVKTVYSHFHQCLQPGTHLFSCVNWGGGVVERMEMTKLQNNSRVYSYPGSLDGESGVLPLSYNFHTM